MHKTNHKGPHSVAPGQAPFVFSTMMGKLSHGTCLLRGGGRGSMRTEGLFGCGQDHQSALATSVPSPLFLPSLQTVPTAGGTIPTLLPVARHAHLPVLPETCAASLGCGQKSGLGISFVFLFRELIQQTGVFCARGGLRTGGDGGRRDVRTELWSRL